MSSNHLLAVALAPKVKVVLKCAVEAVHGTASGSKSIRVGLVNLGQKADRRLLGVVSS